MLACAAVIAVHQVVRSRSLESIAYPVVGLALGLVFTAGLVTNLVRPSATPAFLAQEAPEKPSRLRWLWHPLTVILAVQASLSLTMVWSNTAFTDEADYLSLGHYLIAHWLHGTPWPVANGDHTLSGSPLIYPPIGAMADSLGGLAGARILSLVFMLMATVLLYFTAEYLVGRTGAILAAGLWGVGEPTLRLAFATYDPLSLLFVAFAAWLAVQAGKRRHRGELVTASAACLAISTVTAYSGIVIVPMVIAFAFLVWRPVMGTAHAGFATAWFTAGWAAFFALGMTLSHSWAGFLYTVVNRQIGSSDEMSHVLRDVLAFSGLVLVLAAIGTVAAFATNDGRRALVALLGCATLAVPVAQLHDRTITSLDKHLSYGLWFGVIAAGYGIAVLLQSKTSRRYQAGLALCCAIAFLYPAANNWESAWAEDHVWANATALAASFRHVAAQAPGTFYIPATEFHIVEYYAPPGFNWQRLSDSNRLSFNPPGPRSGWVAYYEDQLQAHRYGVITLVYETTFSARLSSSALLATHASNPAQDLLSLVGANSGEPGLPALTKALESSHSYRIAAIGHYDTHPLSGSPDYGLYAIWRKVQN